MGKEITPTEPKFELINIKDLTPANFLNVDLFKSNQQKLIENNPVVEIIDEATFKISDTSRKALKKGRTSTNASKKIDIDALKEKLIDPLINTYDEIASMTQSLEDLHEANCEEWKKKVAAIEKANAEAEELRKTTIRTTISEFQDTWNAKLTKLDYISIDVVEAEFTEFTKNLVLEDFKEFQIEFSVKHQAILERLKSSVILLTQNEETRLENEKLTAYNTRLEILLSIGSTLSELGITLVNTATENPSEFVSKENLKSMTAEAWEVCRTSFNKVNIANAAKKLEDRSKARVKQIKELSFVLNKENESYEFELKDKSKIECFFTHVKSASDTNWNDIIKTWTALIEEDKKPVPEVKEEDATKAIFMFSSPNNSGEGIVSKIENTKEITSVKIPAENIIVTGAKVVSGAVLSIEQPKQKEKVVLTKKPIPAEPEIKNEGWSPVVVEFFNSTMEPPTIQSFINFLEENYNPPMPL